MTIQVKSFFMDKFQGRFNLSKTDSLFLLLILLAVVHIIVTNRFAHAKKEQIEQQSQTTQKMTSSSFEVLGHSYQAIALEKVQTSGLSIGYF